MTPFLEKKTLNNLANDGLCKILIEAILFIGMRHWAAEDEPWIEHARYQRNCEFVLVTKGLEFVLAVNIAAERAEVRSDIM